MGNVSSVSFDVAEKVLDKLSIHDLATLTRVSRRINALTVPFLYRSLYFRLPGTIAGSESLLTKFEKFTVTDFDLIKHTSKVVVAGTWYREYDALESRLGRENLLSPAVRMLNTLLAVCLGKMPNLREFVWDAQVAPTQTLISRLASQPSLEHLQLRLATNDTPHPYFHPVLGFPQYERLHTLIIIQVDIASVLRSIGNILRFAPQLTEVTVDADSDSRLSLSTMFEDFLPTQTLSLTSLDLRGFVDLGPTPDFLFKMLSASTLNTLTLEVGSSSRQHDDHGQFWKSAWAANMKLKRLSTNIIPTDLLNYVSSFSGVEILILNPTSNGHAVLAEQLESLVAALIRRHFRSLTVLAIDSRAHVNGPDCLLDGDALKAITRTCLRLTEFAFGVKEDDIEQTTLALALPHLRVLHIKIPLVFRVDQQQQQQESRPRSSSALPSINPISSMVSTNYRLNSRRSHLRRLISARLLQGIAPRLRYVAFDDGPIYSIMRNPIRWRVISNSLVQVNDTVLFRDKSLDWVDPRF